MQTGKVQHKVNPKGPVDGQVRGWIDLYTFPLVDYKTGELNGIIEYARDITEQKITELKLKKLEKKYREAYFQASFYKDLFVHDINNILQAILLAIQIISNEMPNEFRNKFNPYINIISEQIKRGSKLVENLKKFTQIDERDIKLKPTEIIGILDQILDKIKTSHRHKEIDFEVNSMDNKIYVKANSLIRDVFEILTTNSIQYNKNAIVEIIVNITQFKEKNKNWVKIELIDNGRGIEDERKNLIFLRAFKESLSVKGMGLGLSLVNKIIQAYNGKIWVEDRITGDYTKGSKFVIIIPAKEEKS
ncbi:MAG: hypothetical protein GF353_27955 [Candidatus Lokiarchaeota archaeon]|nr:hypothetical protein [Candidatus Lokiarchaeota archaeon]